MHVDRQLPAVSKPSPLCMACLALAVSGVQRWPSVPHTWWGCAGACNVWRGTECRWGAVGWGCEQRPKQLTRASRASPRAAQRAPQLLQLPLSSGWIGYLHATEEGAYLLLIYYLLASLGTRGTTQARMRRDAVCGVAVCGAACGVAVCGVACTRGMYAWHVRAACTRGMYARHVCARGRGESAIAHRLPCSS